MALLEFMLHTLVTILIVLDPPGMGPMFVSLTRNADPAFARRMAKRGAWIGFLVLALFALIGAPLLRALGIGMASFRIAGGILLFLISIDMLLMKRTPMRSTTQSEDDEAVQREDISVFPLAIPLIAGPGAMTTMVLLMGRAEESFLFQAGVFVCLAVAMGITYVAMVGAAEIRKLIGVTGSSVIERVLAVILAALAVQFVVDGVRQSFLS